MFSSLNRRDFLGRHALAPMALASLLAEEGKSSTGNWSPPDGRPHMAAKAKSVIWLFMNGGVSHLETFDPKPELDKYAGKTIAATPYKDVQNPEKLKLARVTVVNDANGQQRNVLFPTQTKFRQRGRSGIPVSDFLPNMGAMVDEMAIVRSMTTTDDNHGAQTQFHSGRHMLDGEFPTLGAWVHYGLGSLNANLPQFISMGTREYWNRKDGHYLGPAHDAVPLRVDLANPLDYGKPELAAVDTDRAFRLAGRLNRIRFESEPTDPVLDARVKAYELAYRMQRALPEAIDFSRESEATRRMYGIDQPVTRDFGMQLLASRRLVERGVRFIQIQHGGGGAGSWDAHGNLLGNHASNCAKVDLPVAGLLADLRQRGLLEQTLVVFATEFGRTPGSQGGNGRDHHIFGFTVWMAGGGVKGGTVHGATDELGFHAVEDRHYVTDIHATILHLMGLDSRRLELPERKRLEIDHGHVIKPILA